MSTEQHDADAYGQEPARISHHQPEATDARCTVFQLRPPSVSDTSKPTPSPWIP
ncbi:hypothetical protein ACFW1F_18195 [Streptomyces bungoensis]|uniref:hypothetical protein n=1 Tax=Streptomyces bungoensis TaxID=285568 RepID=UPI0034317E3B